MSTQRTIFRYRGDVQGVGFRANAIHQAQGLSVAGFVRNEPDGEVTMDVQGSEAELKELTHRIDASMSQRINEVRVDHREPDPDRSGFRIRY